MHRRQFLRKAAQTGAGLLAAHSFAPVAGFPAILRSPSMRPNLLSGVSSGDVRLDQATIWSRADRSARMVVEWSTMESMKNVQRMMGPAALDVSDFTAKLRLTGLPAGQEIFYRVLFQSLEDVKVWSEPVSGRFRMPSPVRRTVSFMWSGDTAGQGWGINPDWGGMRIYQTMARLQPDFFIHSGDTIYADGPIQPEVKLPDGTVWKNMVTEAKSKVAETLSEFHGNYAYNLMDEHMRRFNAQVPVYYQWDDHETVNNWYPQEILDDTRYQEKSVALLGERARRAFLDYTPISPDPLDPGRIYRQFSYGPLLDIFMLDMRSYRGPNGTNLEPDYSPASALLGSRQILWLKKALLQSMATWKIIASDMPIGLIVYDDYIRKSTFENGANGNGPALGRELEIADLLRFIKYNGIRNVVWITADVHYTAAHYYDPNQAQFRDFLPFYEFVSGPLHAGTFGPNELDNTFGPQVFFQKHPPQGQFNLPPSAGMQFFGHVVIDGESENMTVTLRDLEGKGLYEVQLGVE